jgi:hypothetical protein
MYSEVLYSVQAQFAIPHPTCRLTSGCRAVKVSFCPPNSVATAVTCIPRHVHLYVAVLEPNFVSVHAVHLDDLYFRPRPLIPPPFFLKKIRIYNAQHAPRRVSFDAEVGRYQQCDS